MAYGYAAYLLTGFVRPPTFWQVSYAPYVERPPGLYYPTMNEAASSTGTAAGAGHEVENVLFRAGDVVSVRSVRGERRPAIDENLLDSLQVKSAADRDALTRAYAEGYNKDMVTLSEPPEAVNVVAGGTKEDPRLVAVTMPSGVECISGFQATLTV